MIIPQSEDLEEFQTPPDESLALDWSRLAELAGNADDFERELIETFLTSAATDVERLTSALERGDSSELVRTAHDLKGASQQIGANSLAALAGTLEDQGAGLPPGRLAELLARVEREMERVRLAAYAVFRGAPLVQAV